MSEKNPFFGATFAERKAARLASEKAPEVEPPADPDVKQVDAEAEQVEDKAVTSAQSKKRTTRKKS